MRIPGATSTRQLLRWLRSRARPRALILGYHRIDAPGQDPYSMCVTPRRFEEHLEVLRRETSPISLSQMMAGLRDGNLPGRSVVVTLDDGYADSLHSAKPVLERQRIPATVFVATGLLGREPWWDRLARIISSAPTLPRQLSISVDGTVVGWDQRGGVDQAGSVEAARQRSIQVAYRALLRWSEEKRERALARLAELLESPARTESGPRGLLPDEVRRLAAGPWVEVGAHSVSHPLLASLPVEAQRGEIEESKRVLESLSSLPIRAFSYPNGSMSSETQELVRQIGFECACASFGDAATRHSDPFRLPRFWVGHRSGQSLARLLRYWG